MSWLRSPLEAIKGIAQGLVDPAVSFYQAAKQRDLELGGPGNPIAGAPDALLDTLSRGEEESRRLIHDKLLRGDPSWIQDVIPLISPQARSMVQTAQDDPFRAAGQLATFDLYPKVGEVAKGLAGAELPNPSESAREFAQRRIAGAAPEAVTRAQQSAEETAAGVASKNEAAASKADLANQGEFSDAQATFNEAHDQWQTANEQGLQKVEDQRQAETAKQTQRKGFDQEANAHGTQAGPALDQLQKDVEADVKGSWPKTPGVGDAERVSTNMQKRVGVATRESGPIPGPIQRIIDRYMPDGGEGEFPAVSPDVSASAYQQLKDEGVFTDDEIAAMEGTGKSPAEPNFENLQSQYSAMGKMAARSARQGDRVAAGQYGAARDVLGDEMKHLTDAAGTTEAFNVATQKFKTMARTFYNKTAVSRAIGKYREIVGSLPDNPDAASIAAPFVRQILASDPKVFDAARAQLSQFQGAPLDELDAMKGAHEQFKSMPSKAKIIPDYVPKPEPQYEPPVPAHTAELIPPPEPFDRQAFIKDKVQRAAENFGTLSGWMARMGLGTVGGALLGHPLAGALTGATEVGGEMALGRLLRHPAVQEWISREPGAPLGQPGASGARGNPTPFSAPPPSSSPQTGPTTPSGAGPSTSAPGPGLRPTATMEVPPQVDAKIKSAGFVSKGEVMPGSGVFQVEHPEFPGKTFSIKATDTAAEIARKLAAMRERFGK